MTPTKKKRWGPKTVGYLLQELRDQPLYWLLLAVPAALALKYTHSGDVPVFLVSCLAIIPLAGLMGRATENLSETMGPAIGGLLNATFGNAAELIIAIMMLRQGPGNYHLIKASLTGSIIGNILLVLGLAIVVGGMFHKRQTFNRVSASTGTTLLALASIGLCVPSLLYMLLPNKKDLTAEYWISTEIAIVLAGIYVLSLLFQLRTHRHLFTPEGVEEQTTGEHHEPEWSRGMSLFVLLISTVGVVFMSECLVEVLKPAAAAMQMSELFVGVIVVAIVGNAAEHSTAVLVAMKNKMDLALTIAVGSSLQIALFVAPVLVFVSYYINPGQPLDLHFTPMELAAVVLTMLVLALVSGDGETNWFEGAMLLAVYVIFGIAFFHWPAGAW